VVAIIGEAHYHVNLGKTDLNWFDNAFQHLIFFALMGLEIEQAGLQMLQIPAM